MKKIDSPSHFLERKWLKILIEMKIAVLLMLVFSLGASANSYSQGQKVSFELKDASMLEVMNEIKAQTGLRFIYNEDKLDDISDINIDASNMTVKEVLEKVFENSNLECNFREDVIMVVDKKPEPKIIEQQEKKSITGQVTDIEGIPLPGVSVVVKGTTIGVATNIDGKYTIEFETDKAVLVFSFVGMLPQEVVYNGQTNVNVKLQADTEALNEVIVTGYQKVSVERTTGSAVTVSAKDMVKKGQSNLINSLEGLVAGLGIMSDPNNEGGKKINIRGVSTLNGNSSPLIVIDGFPSETDISQINPYDVASVTVLKDAGSSSIYGARAANGVIVITTKRGEKGQLKVNYSNNFTFNKKPDIAYRLNRLVGSELVDAHIAGASAWGDNSLQWYLENEPYSAEYYKASTNKVYHTLMRLQDGYMSQEEADAIISPLRSIDNTSQIEDIFTQRPYEEQHNLNISGGTDKNIFRASTNYTKNKSSFIGDKSERIVFDIQNSIKINDKLKLDLSGNFRLSNNKSIPYNRDIVLDHISAYELIRDENGNPLPTIIGDFVGTSSSNGESFGGKDPLEIQRLIDMGLYDETYFPINELSQYKKRNNDFSTRVQFMLYADIVKGLKGTFGVKYENSSFKSKNLAKEESFEMKSLINNMSPNDYSGDESTLIIPTGGRIVESRGDSFSYTMRAQLDYEKSIQKHNLRTLLGSEVRHNNRTATSTDKFGYNEESLQFKYIDKKYLETTRIRNVNHPSGSSSRIKFNDDFSDITNRYFSLYGNFSYDFDQMYVLSGSVRLDQSNLFGTDPKYRYKPFWSVGAKWNVDNEPFFTSNLISRCAVRTSYGINGNIANDYGPFAIATREFIGYGGNISDVLSISSPAVDDLRWERTATINLGLDITAFKRRLKFSFDYYEKNTDGVLALKNSDPTYGAITVMKNSAKIRNKGLEFSLNTTNFKSNNFRWTTNFMVRKNINKVLSVTNEDNSISSLVSNIQNIEGEPVNSFYIFNWGGLDENGREIILSQNGQRILLDGDEYPLDKFVKEDLVRAGSIDPKYTGSVSNSLTYKNFNLSFMFVFSYGHKLLKDSYNGEYISYKPNNIHSDASYAWEKQGDEKITDIPSIGSADIDVEMINKYSTKNIIDAGYMRLRELIFTYTLPSNALNFLPIDQASINFRANNIFLLANNKDGIDPEAHGFGQRYFPVNPSYSFGINVNF